ncbi:MAG: type II toxin-antitoxin system CcdA family antitoxin [Beijerinckiaceae bacterium]
MSAKKAVNISIDQALLAKARAEGINLSAALDETLRAKISKIEAERWKCDNADFIRAANKELEANGLWSDGLRLF